MSDRVLVYKPLGDIDVSDNFFDSLREGYVGFDKWFASKATEKAYILEAEVVVVSVVRVFGTNGCVN